MSDFLAKDGYIDTPEFIKLVRDIDRLAAKEHLKPLEIYYSKRAVVRADHPSKKRLDAAAFEKKRAMPIKMRKRPPASGLAIRMQVLLTNYKGLDEYEDYWRDYQHALKAIERHNARAEKVIEKLKAAAAKVREANNAAFEKNVNCFVKDVADELELEYAVGQSMMGKTVILALPNGGYVSIGKSDKEKFLKAKAAAKEAAAGKKKPAAAGRAKVGAKRAVAEKPSRSKAAPAAKKSRTAAKPAAKKKAPASRSARA